MTTISPDRSHTDVCPPWCVEHYTGDCGTQNHTGPVGRSVVGESAKSGAPMEMHVWPELRVTRDGQVHPVGIVSQQEPDDFELSPEQLRRLAAHLIAVAQMCERVTSQPDCTWLGHQ